MRIENATPHMVKDLTENLQSLLGEPGFDLLHKAVGARETFQLVEWIYGKSYPDDDQLERLLLVYEVVTAIRHRHGASFARIWFTESHCPDGATIYDSVRTCNFDQVRDAANALGANLTA